MDAGLIFIEFFRDFACDTEGRPLGDGGHLLSHKGARIFPHLNQKNVQTRRRAFMTSSV